MPAEFIAEEGPLKGLVLAFEAGEEWSIGRDPDQSVLVVEDPKVSRKHLLCRKTAEGLVLENLSETNPAKINDQEITESRLLHNGDKISIGATVFHYYVEGAPLPSIPGMAEEIETEEEETYHATIFKEEELPEVHFDMGLEGRFILKVIAGPNTGAEFVLDLEREYLIGTDTTSCDIVFHDLSVSRQHARLMVNKEGVLTIEDLGSRNGVLVDRERVVGKGALPANSVTTLGTSAFLVIDREAPAATIAAPILEPRFEVEEEVGEEEVAAEVAAVAAEQKPKKAASSPGALILALIIGGVAILLGVGLVSLFQVSDVIVAPRDFPQEVAEAVQKFSDVQFTYNRSTEKLFLVGHVATGVEKNELLYNLKGLAFIKGIEDNIVIDEAVWQEMNIQFSKISEFQGVSMHSPAPGKYALTGYLKTDKQAAALTDYMNLNFADLSRLDNLVVVEEQVIEEVESSLIQEGLNGVAVQFSNGELTFTGYISSSSVSSFQSLLTKFSGLSGVRVVRSYVVALSPEQAVVELNEQYPGRYQVTGSSKHGDVNINVVINGRILTRGDPIDGMIITSIQPNTIFLEKDGLKYKIEYNK